MNPDYHSTSKSFAPECVRNLQAIIQSGLPLRVVISSSWKAGFSLFKLGYIWRCHDMPVELEMEASYLRTVSAWFM
ncbi:MAG: hypothetical protein EOL87_14175 [Spartobacteria bacterium]|nr:hypothetical protein [Spartobacteria bacterium]